MEGGQPRINPNHLKPAANTGSEREEPKVRPKKRAGAWTTQRPESPSETQDKGRGAPPKEGRNRGTDAATNPSPNKRPRKKSTATKGEGAARGYYVRTAQPSIRRVQNPGVAGGATNL